MSFEGKVVIVTGGARGIGKAVTERLHKGGASVAILGRNADAAKGLASELSSRGAKCIGYGCDVADGAQIDATVEAVIKDFGKIDVLVNNAGITQDGLLVRMNDEAWNAVLNTNLTGAFRMLRACARPMLKARSGSIVNISSVVALIGNAGQANYCAAKAGLIGLTKSAAREFASRGVRVNAVAPGLVDTDMTAKLTEDQKKALMTSVPLGRTGTGSDIAGAVAFLASEDASYVTGQVLSVCGGMAM
ncbi:MAG TPA: 3-oxoacyl-[acyl-carrier-protein] reductase [Planctomycetota bacterium]|nr:3-oxoacyl-[acyl-carrier-protein] reductase [Planctomycetota bacterium]